MVGTYAAVFAVCAAALAIGQAALALFGVRQWSWLSPSLGFALLCAICWGTVRLPGHGVLSALLVAALFLVALGLLRGRVEGLGLALRTGAPLALLALAAVSLPFLVEGHIGILGTSFNPDMSQHLLAAYRLAHGQNSQLLHQGYPLGPHSIVVVLNRGLGIGLVDGFTGLTAAAAVIAPLTALTAFTELQPLRRTAAALLVGLPYLLASYYAQGAFKEILQALYLLAFVLALREATRNPAWRGLPLRFLPAAILAVGSVYTYSFPGLIWLAGTAFFWILAEYGFGRSRRGGTPGAGRSLLLAVLVFFVLIAPEIGRLITFQSFETFAPHGPGLGNLFGQISPTESLGIWPSGDFRLAPGAGTVPALVFFIGVAFALVLFAAGLWRGIRRRETAIISGLGAALLAYAAARIAGTPYTAAKAIEVAAPLVALLIVLALLDRPALGLGRRSGAVALAALAYLLLAGGSSLLALANTPVGPSSYSPALSALRPLIASGSTLVLAPPTLLSEDHGTPYLAWELRGSRVCIEPAAGGGGARAGVRFVITWGSAAGPPFVGLRLRRRSGPYALWERAGTPPGKSECPLIAERQAREGRQPK